VDSLETVTGELVANPLEHSDSGEIAVTLSRTAERVLTVGVSDEGRDAEAFESVRSPPGPEQEHGRGLLITAVPADRWGEHRTAGGRTVWAEFRARD
jgi:anti-sigma regulatory factor (Ser/Thr protein kinase)